MKLSELTGNLAGKVKAWWFSLSVPTREKIAAVGVGFVLGVVVGRWLA